MPVPDSPLDTPLVGPNGIGSPAGRPNGLGLPEPDAEPDSQPEMQPDPQPEMQPDPQPEIQPDPLMSDLSLSVKEACKRACERLIDCEQLEGSDKRGCEDDCEDAVNAMPEDERVTPDCRRLGCEDAQLCHDTVIGLAGALLPEN